MSRPRRIAVIGSGVAGLTAAHVAARSAHVTLYEADVRLGELAVPGVDAPVPFWMSTSQYEYWKHTHLTVDVVKGRGSGFSVEAPEGVRFLIRSRLLTDAEMAYFQLI